MYTLSWIATVYLGPVILKRQLSASTEIFLNELEIELKKESPGTRASRKERYPEFPLVQIKLLRTPVPFFFEARSEVHWFPNWGEINEARYFFAPWRIYQQKILKHSKIESTFENGWEIYREKMLKEPWKTQIPNDNEWGK